jgi:hypothetical protein
MTAHVRRVGRLRSALCHFPLKNIKKLFCGSGSWVCGKPEGFSKPCGQREALSIRATYPQPRRSQLQALYILYIGWWTVSPIPGGPFHPPYLSFLRNLWWTVSPRITSAVHRGYPQKNRGNYFLEDLGLTVTAGLHGNTLTPPFSNARPRSG